MKKEAKLYILIGLSSLFFIIELVAGYASGSVALIADAWHMLSDVASLFIGLYASKLAKSKTVGIEFSFGLQRAEVLGALINGVMLLALAFTIIVEAIQRFFEPEMIRNPWIVLWVGTSGLVVNILGLVLFSDHAHHGHSHGHSHGPRAAENESRPLVSPGVRALTIEEELEVLEALDNPIQLGERVMRVAALMHERNNSEERRALELSSPISSNSHLQSNSHSHNHDNHKHGHDHSNKPNITLDIGTDHHLHHAETSSTLDAPHHAGHGGHDDHHDHHNDMNMHGVFLHVLGDLMASMGVIISTLIIIFVEGQWTVYADPIMSLFITAIIVFATVPLVQSACYILLQRTPSHVSVDTLRRDIAEIPGVLGVHELHVWQLSEAQTIASVHVVVPRPTDIDSATLENGFMEERYMNLAALIKAKLHSHGVHSTTVQPEFTNIIDMKDSENYKANPGTCFLRCTSKACSTKICCPPE